ncbi:two-component sensor histidine kinase [Corynebacterium sp. HMSC070H05]|uniref:sensor histidine kinase n=1 Tax=Corynebacterium sp. HMSC070H05 TaxID=1715096 RepID=UPI0008AA4748|nr:histidine kinase [Corynebacterium sp. HMSC070H05]OHQ52091.1 two-component sensor histidine kinase [Corynebacterium sp. HMSC070H05]
MLSTTRILDLLRVSLHVLVAVLLVVGLMGQLRIDDPLPGLVLSTVFAAVYMAGTVWHYEGRAYPSWAPYAWLAVVAALWVGLVQVSADFVWLEFPLVMLACVILPRWWELVAAAGLLCVSLVAVAAPGGNIGAVVGPSIGTVLAVFIVHAYRALRAEADHYKQMAEDLRSAQRERAAAEHAAGVAQERARLAREVHDTMAQGLSSIVLLGRALDKQLGDDAAARETLDVIRSTAADNLAEARRFVKINSADTVSVEDKPQRVALPTRLERLAQAASDRQRALGEPLEVQVNAVDLPEPAASVAERMVREGLSNIVRHAGASKAVITVDKLGATATIDVFDNGRGISGKEGYGLKGLRARVEEIGGELSVEGNVLAATLPVEEQ